MAPEGQDFYEAHEEDGFVLLSVMVDANQGLPSPEDCASWAESRGLTHPVMADDGAVGPYVTYGFPTYVLIDREMVIQNEDMWPWDDGLIESLL